MFGLKYCPLPRLIRSESISFTLINPEYSLFNRLNTTFYTSTCLKMVKINLLYFLEKLKIKDRCKLVLYGHGIQSVANIVPYNNQKTCSYKLIKFTLAFRT